MNEDDSLAAALRALRAEISGARDRLFRSPSEGLATAGAVALTTMLASHVGRIEARVAAIEARLNGERPA